MENDKFFMKCVILLHICFLNSLNGNSINTPPHISLDREWVLTEDEAIGTVVTRIVVDDDDEDHVSVRLGSPTSRAFQSRNDAESFFVLDDQLRVKLSRSVKGMAGESFLIGVIATDGHVPNRVDAKVTIRHPNEPVKKLPKGLPSSFDPGLPPPVEEFHRNPTNGGGPPLLHLDPFTVWTVPNDAPIGTVIAKVEAQDLSLSFIAFSVEPSDLVSINQETGVVHVTGSLLNQVGDHKLEIKASNLYDHITEEVTLRVTKITESDPSEDFFSTLSLTTAVFSPVEESSTQQPVSSSPKTDSKESIKVNYTSKTEIIEPSAKESKFAGWNVVWMAILFGLIPTLMATVFGVWKYRQRRAKQTPTRKENSVFFRPKGVDIIRHKRRDTILSEIFSAVGIHKRAQSNKYETDVKLPRVPSRDFKKNSTKSSKSFFFSSDRKVDDWEIDRYTLRVLGILGEGCFGQVWKCEIKNLNQIDPKFVAVKTVKESAGETERNDLVQELKVLKGLGKHPNVVSLLGCCTEKDPIFVILEYMSGGKLQSCLRASRAGHAYGNLHGVSDCLTPRDLTIFALQVAKGMVFLSKNGIIHRDLAARNILMGDDKVCKVADFGFARDVTNNHVYERKSDGRLPIRWMATESLFDNIFTTKSDVWSFGILLWEIVTLGSTPYPGMSAAEVMRRVKDGYRLEKPDHCKREIYNIMYYCWELSPNHRPNFEELVHSLESMIMSEIDYIQLDNFPEHEYYNFSATVASGELL